MARKPETEPAAAVASAPDRQRRFYLQHGKRLLDLVLTIAVLPLALPLMVLVALAVWLALGRPVLFRQWRPGLGGRPFTLVKFRSLRRPEQATLGASDLERSTALGRWLRRTSLDELPELWNVLRGEMSLVGPRPLLMKYLERYSDEERRRHAVRPGLTGWAQIHGRNRTTWQERFAQDLWYVDHCSLGLDCRILARTVVELLQADGGVEQGTRLGEYQGERGRRAKEPRSG